jgi:RNA polymerase-binding transcription factor
MDDVTLERFRQQLLEQKRHLHQQAAQMIGSELAKPGDEVPDPADMAENEERRNFELRLRDRERRLLTKIEKALEKIHAGTFGLCENCDQEIDLKRLEARPVAGLCIDCKTEQEDREAD